MAKKEFNLEAVQKQIADIELKISKLTLTKQQLELAVESYNKGLARLAQEQSK